jgi:hypothetical protein
MNLPHILNSIVDQTRTVLRNLRNALWFHCSEMMFVCMGFWFITEHLSVPPKVLDSVELVLEGDDHLVEQKRLPGENNVCCKTFLGYICVTTCVYLKHASC